MYPPILERIHRYFWFATHLYMLFSRQRVNWILFTPPLNPEWPSSSGTLSLVALLWQGFSDLIMTADVFRSQSAVISFLLLSLLFVECSRAQFPSPHQQVPAPNELRGIESRDVAWQPQRKSVSDCEEPVGGKVSGVVCDSKCQRVFVR